MMKKVLSIAIFVLLSAAAFGQAFGGGSGDGHAMTELVLRETSVQNIQASMQVYPNLLQAGQRIYIKHSLPGNVQASLYTLDGREQLSALVQDEASLTTNQLVPGLYLLQLHYQGDRVTYKITVVE